MRALQVTALDGWSALDLQTLPTPEPGPGQVRIRVGAAGINFADVLQSQGSYGQASPPVPFTAGLEFAGTVEALGPDVTGVSVGDRVMGLQMGAFADVVIASADELTPTPHTWSDAQAACFQIQWVTAHACLRTLGRLQAGETVLVHACAGGVGLAAVHLARHFGATVIGTASTAAKLDAARAVGMHHGVDYTDEGWPSAVKAHGRPDLVLEMVGGKVLEQTLALVKPYGRVLVYGAASGEPTRIYNTGLIFRPVEVIGYHLMVLRKRRPDLWARQWEELSTLIAEGVIAPQPGKVWPLEQASEAYQALATRQTTGKQVLVMPKENP